VGVAPRASAVEDTTLKKKGQGEVTNRDDKSEPIGEGKLRTDIWSKTEGRIGDKAKRF